jgi:capsular polysaccharide transport system permease protein
VANASSLSRSLSIQVRVIGALLMREIITRFGRHNLGFMWLFLEPMLFTIGVTILWSATRSTHGSSLAIVPFTVTGYSTVLMWRNAVNRCTKAIEPNLSLLFHRNVTVIDLFAARLLLEIAGATISFIGISAICIVTGWMEMPTDILTMTGAWMLLAWFAIALGLIVGALSERSGIFTRLWQTITYLAFPVSGAFFMVDWLPKPAQEFMLWIPMVHAVEMLREGYFGNAVRPHYSIAYLSAVNSFMLLFGLLLVNKAKSLVSPE